MNSNDKLANLAGKSYSNTDNGNTDNGNTDNGITDNCDDDDDKTDLSLVFYIGFLGQFQNFFQQIW